MTSGSRTARKICLITPGHAASTPRLVKNADALADAGYAVHVVCGRNFAPVDALDDAVFRSARWSHTKLDGKDSPGTFARKLIRGACRRLIRIAPFAGTSIAARAHHAETFRLASAAGAVKADLYLGHCLAGLPAAAWAARAVGAPYGFDAEDFHDGETEEAVRDPSERAARFILQSRLLPGCSHLTAGAPMISEKLFEAYGVRPLTLLNVFPLSEAPAAPVIPGQATADRPAQVYWFSQAIGPRRGLEAVVSILSRMKTPVELRLRGIVWEDYRSVLEGRARREGLGRPIVFLPPGPPPEMARLCAGADLGLSTEETGSLNRDLCLGNKIFTYLLAGLPQLLSATTAQTRLASDLGAAAMVADLARPEEAARRLDAFLGDPAAARTARRTAWELARSRYCWDLEKEVLLGSVRRALEHRR